MAWASAKKQIDELHDQLDAAFPADYAAIQRLYYKLKNLNQSKPGDYKTLVALGQAALSLGKRTEARDFALTVTDMRGYIENDVANSLAILWACMGDFEQAWNVIEPLIKQDPTTALLENLARIGAMLGDLDKMKWLAEIETERGISDPLAMEVLSILGQTPNAAFWPEFTRTLRSELSDVQVYAAPGLRSGEETDVGTVVYIAYVLDTEVDRKELSRRVFDALEKAAMDNGFEPAGIFPEFDFDIFAVSTDGLLSAVG